jgi:ACT domain-containing protein
MKTYPYITINVQGDIGEQLYQISYIINFMRKSKKSKIRRQLVFLNDNDKENTYWNTLFKGLFTFIDKEKYDSLNFTIVDINDDIEKSITISNNIVFEGCLKSFAYIDKSLYTKMLNIVYNNEDVMYPAYYKYRDILDNFSDKTLDDEMVSLHISKKDLIDIDYYKNSLENMNKKYVVIFTDDIYWFSNNILDKININSKYNIYYVIENDKSIEFVLMSMFKNHIIEQTSYSLWASYISYYDNKVVLKQ